MLKVYNREMWFAKRKAKCIKTTNKISAVPGRIFKLFQPRASGWKASKERLKEEQENRLLPGQNEKENAKWFMEEDDEEEAVVEARGGERNRCMLERLKAVAAEQEAYQ